MFLRYKFIALIIFMVMQAGILNAAWWTAEEIPVPPAASEVKRETRSIGGAELNFIYYLSNQAAGQIKEFYRGKLSGLGWQERGIMQDLSQIQLPGQMPGLPPAQLNQALEANLIFEKDQDMLIITFLPAEYSQDAKTRFNLCWGKAIKQAQLSADKIAIPELVDKPKKNVFPAYPGASLITLNEHPNSLRATYFSKDDIEAIISFYKNEMSNYGWSLQDERPVKKMKKADMVNDPSACPTCVKNPPNFGSMETWFGQLDFVNDQKDRCNLAIAQIVPAKEGSLSLEMTTISVSYEEKTK